jgi:riboflavin kinase/FMN adenylyltransferase
VVNRRLNSTVVTFTQNPKRIFSPEAYDRDIITLEEKLTLFEEMGIRRTILIDFSENFSRMEGRVFIDLLIDKGKMVFLAVGSNFRCGYRLTANTAAIQRQTRERGIETEIVEPVLDKGEFISSSMIRLAIKTGDFAKASSALGREFTITTDDPLDLLVPFC